MVRKNGKEDDKEEDEGSKQEEKCLYIAESGDVFEGLVEGRIEEDLLPRGGGVSSHGTHMIKGRVRDKDIASHQTLIAYS